jgi:hypothetical protein
MRRFAFTTALIVLTLLLVLPPASAATPPPNDDIGAATEIDVLPVTITQDVADATTAADDPLPTGRECALATPSHSVWFRHTAGHDALLDASTIGSGYETVLVVYRGDPGGLEQVAWNLYEASGRTSGSRVRFPVVAGTTYHVMVAAAHADALESGSGLVLALATSTVPLLDVQLAVASEAVVNPRTGAVTVRGTATCSRDAWFVPDGHVRQGRSLSFLLGDERTCAAGETVAWEATTVSATRTTYRTGPAEAFVVLYASDSELDRVYPEAVVPLTLSLPPRSGRTA